MIRFSRKFFFFSLALFAIEVLIALYLHDPIIRPYGGDYLVVMLVYCALRTFLKADPIGLALTALLFAYCIEAAQYFRLVDRLGLSGNRLARVVLGYGFEWLDLLAYTLGIATVLLIEKRWPKRTASSAA